MAVQCSTCDNVSTLIDAGDRDIEGLAQILGSSGPAMLTHLKTHIHPRLHDLTFRGSPVAISGPAPDPEPAIDPGVQQTAPASGGGVTSPEPPDSSPSHFADDDSTADGGTSATGEAVVPANDLAASPSPPTALRGCLVWLRDEHPGEQVRAAALALMMAQERWETSQRNAARLAQLRERRDQLQADLEAVCAEITCLEPDPLPPAAPRPEVNMAQVRTWAIANGIHVAPIGKITRAVVDDYLAAHPAVS